MKKIDPQQIYEYVEKRISTFHQRRLDYVQKKVDLPKILKQKNPYLFKAKNVLTAQDLIKGFLDAFLQSQTDNELRIAKKGIESGLSFGIDTVFKAAIEQAVDSSK